MQPDQPYAVLGIHGEDVPSVNKVSTVTNADGSTSQVVEERNVARVRMFVNGQMIDEDLTLPRLITVEEQIEQAALARIAEIEANGLEAESKIVPQQTERIVAPITEGAQNV